MVLRRSFLILWALAALAGGRRASAAEVRPKARALLMLKVLAYDRNLKKRAGKRANILIVHRAGHASSESTARDMLLALKAAASRVRVSGLRINATGVAYGAGFSDHLLKSGAVAVYVCEGLGGKLATISRHTRARKALTFTNQRDFVRRRLGVGIVAKKGRAKLLVNLPASRAEGAKLSSALLRLARVFR